MPVKNKYYILLLVLLYGPFTGWCQVNGRQAAGNAVAIAADTVKQAPHFIISNIFIRGNRKTKIFTIERELSIASLWRP